MANSALSTQVVGAQAWHTNADEPSAYDYNDYNQAAAYSPDPFRASDHDSLIVGLNLTPPPLITPAVPALPARWLALLGLALAGLALHWHGGRARSALN
jgi:hypothetical protein